MKWQPAEFKGKTVWASVSAPGELEVDGGRVPIRYSKREGAKIYRAGASRVALDAAAPPEDLPEGISADDAKKKKKKSRGSGFGKAGTRTKAQAAMAAAAARQAIAELEDHVVLVFTDGGCRGNPGPAGSGAVVRLPDGRVGEGSLSLGRATNNIAELEAIGLALDLLEEADVAPDAEVALFSDSGYCRGVLTQGWKAKKNRELILGLRERIGARPGLELRWVAGHVGIDGNERADTLANRGVDGVSSTDWTEA